MESSVSLLQSIYQENKEIQIEIEKKLLAWNEDLDEIKQELYHMKAPQSTNQQFFSPFAAASYEQVHKLEEKQSELQKIIHENEIQRERLKRQNEILKELVKEHKNTWSKQEFVEKLLKVKSLLKYDPEKAEYILNTILEYLSK